MENRIPFIKPEFPPVEEVAEDLREIYKNNYYTNNGPIYRKFMQAMQAYLGQDLQVVGLNNATTALMLAMKACFNPKAKYVALPAFTFPAGPLAIEWCGWQPVFFDINDKTGQPSLESFEILYGQYGSELAGILLVNNFGIGNEEIGDWEHLAEQRKLALVIDSAPGIGSEYPDGRLLGGRGTCEIFSMHATKPFGVGEGGLLTTKDQLLAERIESLKNFGFGDQRLTDKEGLNGKITELDCAIGLRILKRFDSILQRRRAVYILYEQLLASKEVQFLPYAQRAAIQFATIIVRPEERDAILASLARDNIEARTYYAPPLHLHPQFKDSKRVDLTGAEKLSLSVISLPVHNDMQHETVERVAKVIISKG